MFLCFLKIIVNLKTAAFTHGRRKQKKNVVESFVDPQEPTFMIPLHTPSFLLPPLLTLTLISKNKGQQISLDGVCLY